MLSFVRASRHRRISLTTPLRPSHSACHSAKQPQRTRVSSAPVVRKEPFGRGWPIRQTEYASSPICHKRNMSDAAHEPRDLAMSDDKDPIAVRWMHTGTKYLALPTAPVNAIETAYRSFSELESRRIETAWEAIPYKKRREIVSEWGLNDGEWSQKTHKDTTENETPVINDGLPDKSKDPIHQSIIERDDPPELDKVTGVPVSQDSLFEVDLKTLSLHPVFWPKTGPRVPVIRGTWFMDDETRPCTWDLARDLENGYDEVKPWTSAYQNKLAAAKEAGSAEEEKLQYKLPRQFGKGVSVIFEDATRCRIVTSGAFEYLSRAIWSSFGSTPGGTYIYRGYSAAVAAKKSAAPTSNAAQSTADAISTKQRNEKPSVQDDTTEADNLEVNIAPERPDTPTSEEDAPEPSASKFDSGLPSATELLRRAKEEFESRKRAMEEQNTPITRAHNDERPCTDLVLVIHGIGQHLAAQYESLNFIYSANQFRRVLRKQSSQSSVSSVMGDGRFQVLPVQWRANLSLESESAGEDAQKVKDNVFTIADITIGKSIPYVREITNAVLLDIPLFMSQHRQQMIEAVCEQANRLYRLWIARHPDFEEHGRVHIIGHSLGSALAAHILSNQPTIVPRASELPAVVLNNVKDHFIFNTSNLYLCGSPLGIFLGLQQSHLIARAGRQRAMDVPLEVAKVNPGEFGCMAVDSVYNVFYYTDPVAYALNPTVDVAVAKDRPPLAIPSVTGSFFPSVSLPSKPAMPQMPSISGVTKYLPAVFGDQPKEEGNEETDKERDQVTDSQQEPKTTRSSDNPQGTIGERRFAALNPRGSIDFSLPSSSSVNDYFDMITAHTNYWADPNFATFILKETFDSVRSGEDIQADGSQSSK